MLSDNIRTSIIAPYIDGLLEEKHANGYSYASEELVLNRFDSYCTDRNLDTLEITRDFLDGWMERTPTEGESNRGKRISVVRQLLLFMATCGLKEYIPHDFCHFKKALPHIFEKEEVAAFFEQVDFYIPQRRPAYEARLADEYRLLFRWYLCMGLRNSEACGIATENVDLNNGILTILNSKGAKDRLVYMPEDLKESSCRYLGHLQHMIGFRPKWFFPGMKLSAHLPNTTVDSAFRRFWNRTSFSGCSNKPTVHDFRFSFVVHRMNAWAEEGMDLSVMMPYLSRYLGHKSTNETLYYYYLISDAYRTVEKKDSIADAVIPEVVTYE